MYALALEEFDSWAPEATDLLFLHRAEVGELDPRRPFVINWAEGRKAAEAGVLKVWTARGPGGLAGYLVWYLIRPLDAATVRAAEMGPWFVEPGARGEGLGMKLMMKSISDLRGLGCQQVYPHFRSRSGPRLDEKLWALGAQEIERVYSLWIGD